MTLNQRRILTFILFLLLLSIGPGLIFYGAGYRLNLKQKRIERVGLLHITTDPENTTITIDGQSHPIPDELVLSSLQPKEYDIVISKTDYHSWYKRLEIFPGESTFIRDLQLFVDSPIEKIDTIKLTPTLLENTIRYSYFQSARFLLQLDYTSDQLNRFELPNQFEVIQFKTDEKGNAVFMQNALWYYFDGKEIRLIDVSFIDEDISSILLKDERLYVITQTGVYKMDIGAEEANLIVQQTFIQDIFIAGDDYWFLAFEPSKKHSFLYKITNEQARPELITTIPYQAEYTIEDNFSGFLTISSKTEEKLILVDANTLPAITEEITNVKNWDWSKNEKELLIATEFELLIFHFDDAKRQELLLRLSKPFTDVIWENNETHALYIAEDQLQLVERDERFQRNNLVLTEPLPQLQILSTQDSGASIYLTSINEKGEMRILKQLLR